MQVSQAFWRVVVVFILLALNSFVIRVPSALATEPEDGYSLFLPVIGHGFFARIQPPTGVFINTQTSFAYRSSLTNALYILGEVHNNSGQNVGEVVLQARVFNAANQLLDTRSAAIFLPVLPQGSKTCFAIIFPNDDNHLNNWTSFEFAAPTYTITTHKPYQLTVSQLAGRLDASTREYIVTGTVRNDETTQVKCIQSVGSIFNTDGKITGCTAAYLANLNLSAGASSTFEIRFYGRNYSDYTGFIIQADGAP